MKKGFYKIIQVELTIVLNLDLIRTSRQEFPISDTCVRAGKFALFTICFSRCCDGDGDYFHDQNGRPRFKLRFDPDGYKYQARLTILTHRTRTQRIAMLFPTMLSR